MLVIFVILSYILFRERFDVAILKNTVFPVSSVSFFAER